MIDAREQQILDYIKKAGAISSKKVHEGVNIQMSYATIKRILTKLNSENYLSVIGQGKGTKYTISPTFELIQPIDIGLYYEKEIDERDIKEGFNFSIITEVLANNNVFTESELIKMNSLQEDFRNNISQLSESEYKREFERLAIDLSWKSSQIEGNTYSLLETERLLKEKETAAGKTKEEASMLLNHKDALDFIIDKPDYLYPLTVSKIEDIHSILIKDLAVE